MDDVGAGAARTEDTGRSDLLVSGEELPRVRFRPSDSPVHFGRSREADLQICRRHDTDVPRWAGAFLWHDGLWYVVNESLSRPIYIVVDGTPFPLAPKRADGSVSTWAIAPPGTTLQFVTPSRRIDVQVQTARDAPDRMSTPEAVSGDDPVTPRGRLRPRDRQLVSAKFLAHGVDGPILGDREAAEVGNAHLPADEREFTHSAVMNAVVRARDVLTGLGVDELGGAHNMPRLRRELISWGLLAEQDGHWLRPEAPGSAGGPWDR